MSIKGTISAVDHLLAAAAYYECSNRVEGTSEFNQVPIFWQHHVFRKIWMKNGRPNELGYGERAFHQRSFKPNTEIAALKECADEIKKIVLYLEEAVKGYGISDEEGDRKVRDFIRYLDLSDESLSKIRNELFSRVHQVASAFVSHQEFGQNLLLSKRTIVPETPHFSVIATSLFRTRALAACLDCADVPEDKLISMDIEKIPLATRTKIGETITALASEELGKPDFARNVFTKAQLNLSGRTKQLIVNRYSLELRGVSNDIINALELPKYGPSGADLAKGAVSWVAMFVLGAVDAITPRN